jgi:hypothetical protein
MLNPAKLQLSAEESAMVQDSQWLLTKNTIMLKAGELFGEAASWLQRTLAVQSVSGDTPWLIQSPKIAKGENYNGLPYVMLDYPRYFGRENVFAFRTMFWWGHFFSVTWHLKGTYAARYRQRLPDAYESLRKTGFYIGIHEDEWHHHFEPDNYQALSTLSADQFNQIIDKKEFIKLAVRIPLEQWNCAMDKLTEVYQVLLETAGVNFPTDETDP